MPATKAEIRNKVGAQLRLVPIGQALQYQDQVEIEAAYDQLVAELKDKGLLTWTTSVPDELVPYVRDDVSYRCAQVFPVSEQLFARLQLAATIAMQKLRELTAPDYESLDDPVDF